MAPIHLFQSRDDSNCPNSISGGGIAGIVLGTMAGTLLLLWLWKLCAMNHEMESEPDYGETNLPTNRARHRHRQRRSPSYYYVEKPRSSVRRPAKVYLN
ncbi:uncharacterized protein BO66DRAFT_394220 [Aspergillus aculeatinus CBS 121060]|uniref:Uncharacterized protein n=2 Tax=Aspergillus subgen. Circumdati TaxID=2720871 RepID=A0ACD1H043_9EURO|nr:hypothetical protein BO66DRAFT_394220 [Aspergillus aculeatinus CBS 121060]RAH66943.1 hypothetical protein BO66DRAFT_394220 [Aspergillus aculeatinus CBS 121060]